MQRFPLFQPHPTALYSSGSSYKISAVKKKKKKKYYFRGPSFFEPAETEDHSGHSPAIECLKTVNGIVKPKNCLKMPFFLAQSYMLSSLRTILPFSGRRPGGVSL